ncbi:16S rRNA (cytosine1402-N4)-methyltransferase [Rhizobiales bacterium GAS188]|nr:16S rRNA (cytosine1402-N4)-methyltransferase [Rhizobiales bacterium GAS188]
MLAHHNALVPARPAGKFVRGGLAKEALIRPRGVGEEAVLERNSELSSEADHPLHVPVLLTEVMEALGAKDGGTYIDATFGAGGYSAAILRAQEAARLQATRLLALDRDRQAVRDGAELVAQSAGRLTLVEGRFGEIAEIAREHGLDPVDGVVFDIGVSSMQIDRAERGFSFRHDGPLDMRMSPDGPTAADLVASESLDTIADILRVFGEERHAGRISRAIVAAREVTPILTTRALQRIVASAVPPSRDGIDPATRTFQALRIAVNDELGELLRGLVGAASLLAPGGRLVVVTFHSLEDRIVKRFLQGKTAPEPAVSRHLPGEAAPSRAFTRIAGPIGAGPAEIARNPRARSAKLRFGERGSAPLATDISALADLTSLPQRGPGRRRRA